ncbi:hypothetical protein H4R34_000080 [Dimargaris verticillata]|uniref:Cytochrome P450 n=1 Tax=Dimargaris verticillata TaxID=2761393 RepID=A0A9W8BCC8_9FUNG|nr:hypothetical protein H4R34_000080 [Dimargaris verticillata]
MGFSGLLGQVPFLDSLQGALRFVTARLVLEMLVMYIVFKVVYILYFSPYSKIPGPKYKKLLPFWADLSLMRGQYSRQQRRWHQQYGPVVQTGKSTVIILDPQALKTIYSSHRFPKHHMFYQSLRLFAENLFTTCDPTFYHKRLKLIAPMYSPSSVKRLEPLVYRACQRQLLDSLKERLAANDSAGPPAITVNMVQEFQRVTFSIIQELCFGGEEMMQTTGIGQDQIQTWIGLWMKSTGIKLFFPDFIMSEPPFLRKYFDGERQLFSYMRRIVNRRLELIAEHEKQPENAGKPFVHDILQALIDARDPDTKQPLSMVEVCAELGVQLNAGFETTSGATVLVVYALLLYPQVYETVMAELDREFPDRSKPIVHSSDYDKLTYLEATVYEALRYYPLGPMAPPRMVPKGGTTLCGYYLPEGTDVGTSIYTWSHSPTIFENPERFDPGRYLGPDAEKNRNNMITFMVGVRQCIGRRLAWAEMLIILANFLRAYSFTSAEPNLADKKSTDFPVSSFEDQQLLVTITPRS